ncbi:hypothetical protein ACP8HZ_05305 [Francisella noatunensis]
MSMKMLLENVMMISTGEKSRQMLLKVIILYVFTTKKSYTSEYLLYINEGFLWIETEKIPIMTENNEVIGILGIAQDVTYRKTLISPQYKKK